MVLPLRCYAGKKGDGASSVPWGTVMGRDSQHGRVYMHCTMRSRIIVQCTINGSQVPLSAPEKIPAKGGGATPMKIGIATTIASLLPLLAWPASSLLGWSLAADRPRFGWRRKLSPSCITLRILLALLVAFAILSSPFFPVSALAEARRRKAGDRTFEWHGMSAKCHVLDGSWFASQNFTRIAGRCSHVFGLLARFA
jgi:hypothetical protein